MPDVDEIERYGRIDPSFPNRLMQMAEAQTTDASRRADEQLKADNDYATRGQIASIILFVCCVGASIGFFAVRNPVAGGILLGAPVLLYLTQLLRRP